MTPPAPWVILVNYNGLDDTRACLRSLAASTAPVHVVVVDNASKIDPVPLLGPEFPRVHWIASPANGGWAGGNNRGMEYALARGAELLILLNNDTRVTPDFITRMTAAAAAHPDYAVLGPVIRYMDEPDQIQTMGVAFNRPGKDGFFGVVPVVPGPADPAPVADVDIVNGCCLMARRALIDHIGLVDEAFFLIHEESDWCLRAKAAGLKCGVVAADPVYHKGSSTFKREGRSAQRYYDARNLVKLLARHGGRRGGRSPGAGFAAYARYAFHRYTHEREAGSPASAEAVLEGVYDGLTGRYGPRGVRPRWGLLVLRLAAAALRRLKGGRASNVITGGA